MNNRIEWDDLRLVLAVHDAGTLSGAGRRLGVSHATVHRRLAVTEQRLGVKLFNAARTGYMPTPAGEELATTARQIEGQVQDAERRVIGRDLRPSGTVRVATLDSFLVGFLSQIFSQFQTVHPDISLEISVSNQLFNLSKREADVAIRPSQRPASTLVGRKAGTIAYAVYGRCDLVPSSGNVPDSGAFQWVGPDETMHYPELTAWMADHGHEARCGYRVNSVVGMHSAVSEGHGLAVLPCYLGDRDQRLARFGDPIPELETGLWTLTHPDLRRTARVRALLDFLATSLKAQRGLLGGHAALDSKSKI